MKLIHAIVRDEDDNRVISQLNRAGFSVTKLATTGGFLRAGNTTLIIGVDEDKLEDVLAIIRKDCASRKTIITSASPMMGMSGCPAIPVTVEVGGATVFVQDVERFEKI